MWCRNCNIQTNAATCPVCLSKTEDVVETDTFWCDNCNIPVIRYRNDHDKATCPICSGKIHYLAVDIRPVFPEERLLLAILLDKEPDKYMSDSVWAANSRYYINGQPIALPSSLFQNADTDTISKSIAESQSIISYHSFNEMVERFISANKWRLDFIKDEARSFIKSAAEKYPRENIVISFSGGKDSTVTADVTIKALSDPSIVHIFGNTTLEFPTTVEYAERYRAAHSHAIIMIAKNDEQEFYDVCEDIGPPARMMRWCCSMFKTGPITRVINSMYRSQRILTFYVWSKVCQNIIN